MSGLFGGNAKSTSDERFTGLQLQTSAYGKPIPLGYGTARLAPNLLWYGSFVSTPHTEDVGGKGGGGGAKHTTYSYQAAVVMGLGEGTVAGVGTVWADKQQTTLAGLGFTLFTGAPGQATWSFLTTNHPTQAIPYNATAYVANGALQLGNSPSLPNLNFEVQFPLRYNVGAGVVDAEPSAFLTDYLTNTHHGAGFPFLQSFAGSNNYRTYCIAMGFFLSPVEQSQRPAVDFIDEVCRITNSAPVWSDGVLKIIPYADGPVSGNSSSYVPDLTPLWSFTDDDYIHEDGEDPVIVRIKPPSEVFNVVRVEFQDRALQYNTNIAEAKDEQDIDRRGLRVMPTVKFDAIKDMAVARQVAQLILQRQLGIRREFRFRVRADYSLAEPMDVIEINDGDDIVDQLARIIEIEDDEEDVLTINAEELPIGPGGAPRYNWQLAQGYSVNYAASPGDVNAPAIINAPRLLADPANGGYEAWVAVSAPAANWGGADVFVSFDDVQYQFMGRIYGPARYGTITASIGAGADPDTSTTLSVLLNDTDLDLVSGTTADADGMRSLIWVDGEVMSFRTATLTGPGAYNLTYLRRGKYGTTRAAHSSGTRFIRLDPSIFKLSYDPGLVGQNVYFKFRSFNVYGFGTQDIAAVPAYTHVLASGPTAAFRARGNCVVTETVAYKSTVSALLWNSDVYSVATYANGCNLTFQACRTDQYFMVGLNSDPTTDQTYTSLDYAFECSDSGQLSIYESGSVVGAPFAYGTYTTSTVLSIKYDGQVVQYFKDAVLLRQVSTVGRSFFFDSSFYGPGAAIKNFEFTPLTASASVPFIAGGSCVATASTARKLDSGSSAWDSHVYSAQGFRNGAFVSFQPDNLAANIMVGLNTDPLTDQSFTSIDYAWFVDSGAGLHIFESGSEVVALGSYTTNEVLAISYDGKVVRYVRNGSLIRERPHADATFFMDSSFHTPGGSIRNLTFTPFGTATPVPFLARGNCVVHNTTAMKQGGSNAWDSDFISINSYPTCHLRFKPSQTNAHLIVGLNTDPFTDQSYPSIDFAWYSEGAGTLFVFEGGSNIGSFGSYTTSTELAITYDGSNVRYLKDRVVVRTVALASASLFADASFFTPGAAINSLHFGPGTSLEALGTPGIEPGAATTIMTATGGTGSITGTLASPNTLMSVSVPAQEFDTTVVVTFVCNMRAVAVEFGASGIWAYIRDVSLGIGYDNTQANARCYAESAASVQVNAVAIEETFSLPANTARTYNVYAFRSGGGASGSANYVSGVLKAEVIKR